MGRVEGKVAFITGAARGQGRSHAVGLAKEGANLILIDACRDVASIGYPMATEDELAETVALVEALDRRVLAATADVRDTAEMKLVLEKGVAELGKLDIVVANAGISSIQPWDEVTPEIWSDTIDINLRGVWNTLTAGIPHLIAARGGSMIATGSIASVKGIPYGGPYVAAKHGVLGIVRSLANELGPHQIRVNCVLPTAINTMQATGTMDVVKELFEENPSMNLFEPALPGTPLLEPEEVTAAILFLAGDESRHVTGIDLRVDAGNTIR
jgi:SDR family mycofactocin-dependent oxidoreductase